MKPRLTFLMLNDKLAGEFLRVDVQSWKQQKNYKYMVKADYCMRLLNNKPLKKLKLLNL